MSSRYEEQSIVNVGPAERVVSILSGLGLGLWALIRPTRTSLPAGLMGGYLMARGMTGRCTVYRAFNITRGQGTHAADVKVRRALTINKPRREVYDYWRRLENLPNFMEHLESVEITGERTSHWKARSPLGDQVEWQAEIVHDQPGEEIMWRSLEGSEIDNSGRVRFKDAPGERGTEVYVDLYYRPPAGSPSVVIAKLLGEEPDTQVREDLRRFKRILESGETPITKGQSSGRVKQVQEERQELARKRPVDRVQEASEQSFPASDPPGWSAGKQPESNVTETETEPAWVETSTEEEGQE